MHIGPHTSQTAHRSKMLRLVRDVFCILLFLTTIKSQQCPVLVPTIVSSSSSDDVCAVVSQETLRYICNIDKIALTWSSSVFSGNIIVLASQATVNLPMPPTGVNLTENDNDNTTCLNSTLTFTGTVADLEQLNGGVLTCIDGADASVTDTVTIVIPVLAGPPTSMSVSSTTCGSNGNQVTLQWTPPTNTGGQGVMITHYIIAGLPQSASCSTGPCGMVNGTATIITGLQCNTSYNVAVTAVNCRGEGSSLQVLINLSPPGIPSFSNTNMVNCIDNDDILLNWTAPMAVQSDCGFSLSYNLTVSDNDSLMTTDTNARVPVDGSDNYTVTIFASNGCPGLAEEIVISTTCPSSTATPDAVSTMTPTTPGDTVPPGAGIGPIAGGAAGGIIVVAGLSALIGFILGCVCCPCFACCLLCRKKLCGCCPESWICCGPHADGVDYGEPTPHVEKQPVLQSYSKETKEKDVETGQPSYPPGPMYQDPSTIQRQAAPSGDLYAQPEKPARHHKQKPAVEMATYQDPSTIQRQAAPTTGDLYAQPEKPPKQPPGPAPVYSQVDKPQTGGIEYADLSHSVAPPNARRPAQVPDTFYAEVTQVRESRP